MADISTYLQAIMSAVYGEDVRGSIHDAIEIINDVSEVVLSTGTAVDSASSSSTGFFPDTSLYFNTSTKELWKCIGTDSWQSQGLLKGDAGVGITSIAKTGTSGLIDTYTITYSDGDTDTFTVTNGADGTNGVGISSIEKTGTAGLVDTYTITYTDGDTDTFTVTNGADGVTGNKWYTGTVISGKSVNPTIFSGSGITEAIVGDMYMNTSEGAVYHCTTGGAPSVAAWVYDFTISGGGAGATVLSDLQDVDITSIADGQILVYSSSGSKWINSSALSSKQDASTAVKHTASTAVGSGTQGVYIASDGTATAMTYEVNKTVPSDAVFTDTTYSSESAVSGGTAVSLCTTGEKYTWNQKVDAVSVDGTGTASSSVAHYQRVGVTDAGAVSPTYVEIDGTKYMQQTVATTSTSATTVVTFTHADITDDSVIDVYVSEWGLVPDNVSCASGVGGADGTCAVTLPVTTTAITDVVVRIYIR